MVLTILLMFLFSNSYAAQNAGTVIIFRGTATKSSPGQKTSSLQLRDELPEGVTVSTGPQSFVKILLRDQTQMSVGPDSTVKVELVQPNIPSVVEVISGQIRAKVVKDLKGAEETKFLIKTKTAAMGVRGTEFEVVFNQRNQLSSILTYEGTVSVTKSAPNLLDSITNPRAVFENKMSLESLKALELLKTGNAVLVKEGQYSGSTPQQEFASVPVKISPAQFSALRKNDGTTVVSSNNSSEVKKFQSPIPPGVNARDFVANSPGILRLFNERSNPSDRVGGAGRGNDRSPAAMEKTNSNNPPPEGFYDKKTGKFAPTAGGYFDLKSGIYVPPPPGSPFDPNTGLYVPPANYGGFDVKSGSYKPPEGFRLDAATGAFVPVQKGEANNAANGGRNTAAGKNPVTYQVGQVGYGNATNPGGTMAAGGGNSNFNPNGPGNNNHNGPTYPPDFYTQPNHTVDDPNCPTCAANGDNTKPPILNTSATFHITPI